MNPFRSPDAPPLHLQAALWFARRILRLDCALCAGDEGCWRFYMRRGQP